MTPTGKALLEPRTAAGLDMIRDCARWGIDPALAAESVAKIEAESAAPLRDALTAVIRKLWADADAIEDSQTGTQKARSIAAEALRAAAVEVDKALAANPPAATEEERE